MCGADAGCLAVNSRSLSLQVTNWGTLDAVTNIHNNVLFEANTASFDCGAVSRPLLLRTPISLPGAMGRACQGARVQGVPCIAPPAPSSSLF
jgi:hypothetical protein